MNANKMIVDRDSVHYELDAYRNASQLAGALLAEIMTKKFDEKADLEGSYQDESDFTVNSKLGTDSRTTGSGRNRRTYYERTNVDVPDTFPYSSMSAGNDSYDDVDDYDGYVRHATSGVLSGFVLTVDVYYVTEGNLGKKVTTRKYYKRIDVRVTNTTYFPKRDKDGDGVEEDVVLTYSTVKTY